MTADQYEQEQEADEAGRVTAGVMALVLMGVMALAGCSSEPLAKTWPEVADKHWFAGGLLIAWLALVAVWALNCMRLLIRPAKDKTP